MLNQVLYRAQAICLPAVVALTLNAGLAGNAAAMKIQSVRSPGGVEAWLVEHHGLPLLSINYAFMGGSSQDPKDRQGVANFLTAMLDEGAGDMKAAEFQERIEDLAVKISHETGRDVFTGSFQTLTGNLDQAADLLRLALTKPRFDDDAIARMRQQLQTVIKFDAQDPDKVANDLWYHLAYGDHPYGRAVNGTIDSVGAIGRADLEAYRSRVFAKDNIKISVVGDITAEALGTLLDKVFGDLPAKANLLPVAATEPSAGPRQEVVEMDVPQSVVQFGHGGIARKDPDFIAAFILNYVIGGGGFGSRLMDEVREKRGLAYSVYTYLQTYQRSAAYLGGVATKNEAVSTSLDVIRTELERIAQKGPTPEEFDDAKKFLTGSYALRFDSSNKIAGQLLGVQIEELGIDYIDKRNGLIDAVTIDDVRRVAKRLLKPEAMIVTIVGKPAKPGAGG